MGRWGALLLLGGPVAVGAFGWHEDSEASTCVVSPDAALRGCERPTTYRFVLNSCGDVYGPTVVNRAMAAVGADLTSE